MSAWAKPGVKCVCVDNTRHPELIEGRTYTVVRTEIPTRDMVFGKYAHAALWVEVAEAKNWDGYRVFAVERFRPLTTRTQSEDVALFRKLLVTEGADA